MFSRWIEGERRRLPVGRGRSRPTGRRRSTASCSCWGHGSWCRGGSSPGDRRTACAPSPRQLAPVSAIFLRIFFAELSVFLLSKLTMTILYNIRKVNRSWHLNKVWALKSNYIYLLWSAPGPWWCRCRGSSSTCWWWTMQSIRLPKYCVAVSIAENGMNNGNVSF